MRSENIPKFESVRFPKNFRFTYYRSEGGLDGVAAVRESHSCRRQWIVYESVCLLVYHARVAIMPAMKSKVPLSARTSRKILWPTTVITPSYYTFDQNSHFHFDISTNPFGRARIEISINQEFWPPYVFVGWIDISLSAEVRCGTLWHGVLIRLGFLGWLMDGKSSGCFQVSRPRLIREKGRKKPIGKCIRVITGDKAREAPKCKGETGNGDIVRLFRFLAVQFSAYLPTVGGNKIVFYSYLGNILPLGEIFFIKFHPTKHTKRGTYLFLGE